MNTHQHNKLDAYKAVEALLTSAPEIANVPGLPGKVAVLSAKTGEIDSLAQTQTQPIQASTTKRDKLLEEMTEMTLDIAGFITTVAREQNLPELAELVIIGAGYRRMRRAHRLIIAQRVADAAQTVLPHLGSYGVTADTLASLREKIQVAGAGLTIPRSTTVVKKAATTKLAALFAEVDILLREQIDPLVFPLRKTQVEFYARYRAARSIVDRRGPRRGSREEASTSAPVPLTTSTQEKAAA
jgi:hypothetical protein